MNNQPAPSSFLASKDMPRAKMAQRRARGDVDAAKAKMTSGFALPALLKQASAATPATPR